MAIVRHADQWVDSGSVSHWQWSGLSDVAQSVVSNLWAFFGACYGPSSGPAMGLLWGLLWIFLWGRPSFGACYMGLPLGLLWAFLWACCGPSFAACYMGLPLGLLWAFLWGLLCPCIHGLHGEHILRVLHSLWQRTYLELIFITLAQDTFCIYFHGLSYTHSIFSRLFSYPIVVSGHILRLFWFIGYRGHIFGLFYSLQNIFCSDFA